jgi:hypothetical protein
VPPVHKHRFNKKLVIFDKGPKRTGNIDNLLNPAFHCNRLVNFRHPDTRAIQVGLVAGKPAAASAFIRGIKNNG